MRQIKKLYDVMALVLKKILISTNEHDFEKMRNLEEDYVVKITETLKTKFPDLFDKETMNVAEISEPSLMKTTLTDDLIKYTAVSQNKEELIFLAKNLDSFLEDTFYDCIPPDQEQLRFHCLNTNHLDCGIYLLPRIACRWEHLNRDAYTSYNIFYYLRNFYFVTSADMDEYTAEHILMPRNLFRDALQRGRLSIVVSPITNLNIVEATEPYSRDNTRWISIKPMKPELEQKIQSNTLDVLQKAVFEEADLLVFPEMLGTEAIVQSLGSELDLRESINDNAYPRLTISPTVWQMNRNFCTIFNDVGDTICEQQKHHGVDLKLGQHQVKEDIHSDQKIYILHCYGIGRIAIMICKDFLITSYLKILAEKLRVTLLIVPSFTGTDYQFELLSSKYGDLDCGVIWINTCASRWLNKPGEMKAAVTLAFLPGKTGIKKSKTTQTDLCGNRQHCDHTCIYTYQIGWEM